MIFRCIISVCVIVLLVPVRAYAADTDIVINEIAAYEQSDYEWIEVYNKGNENVDITGWKFFEANTNHSLTAYRGDLVIEPGEYVVIANKADKVAQKYSAFAGTLIDSAWSTLSESGEQIALKNKSGNIIEQFIYISAPDRALEREDPVLADYTSVNWAEHANGNTIGLQNSNYQPQEQQNKKPDNSQQQTKYIWKPSRGVVLFNELVSDPADMEREWIELYNPTQRAIALEGWTIEDGDGGVVRISGTLGTKDTERYTIISLSDGFLNNAGDRVVLRTADNIVVDILSYGAWDDGDITDNAPHAVDPFSLARISAGVNSFNNRDDFRVTVTPTKGTANVISEKEPSNDTTPESQGAIRITEAFPNPATNESAEEFIELYNSGETEVVLEGWELVLLSGMKYIFPKNETLAPKEYRAYSRKITNLALKNSGGERIRLYARNANITSSEVRYAENAPRGQSYAADSAGKFQWTMQATPGSQNALVHGNRPPEVVIDGPLSGRVKDPLTFDASDTRDPDGDVLSFEWHFGDGVESKGIIVNHAYADSDSFSILLKVSDGKTTVARAYHVNIESADTDELFLTEDTRVSTRPAMQSSQDMSRTVKNKKAIPIKQINKIAEKKEESSGVAPLSEVRSKKPGSHVQTEGVVSAQPGLLGAGIFYIIGSSGIQIWNPKKEFPELKRGDRVFISGTVRKNNKELSIKIADANDIVVKEAAQEPGPRDIKTSEISESLEGWLIRTSGTITDMRWPNIYFDDGNASARVYVSKNTGIEKESFKEGNALTVTGIVSETTAGYRILPRDKNDIILATSNNLSAENISVRYASREPQVITLPAREDPRISVRRYFYATLIASIALVVGLFLQYYLDRKKQK